MYHYKSMRIIVLMVAAAFIVGCVQVTPIPSTARAGDAVVFGLGGIKRNWAGEAPKNVQVNITDSSFNTYSAKIERVFRAYPDYRSTMNLITIVDKDDSAELEVYDGGWFVQVRLTDAVNAALPLALGTATVNITADNYINMNYTPEGDLSNLSLEIIDGVTDPEQAYWYGQQFQFYQSSDSYFEIKLNSALTETLIGGATYVLDYNTDSIFNPNFVPMVFPGSHHPFVSVDYHRVDNGDGTGKYYITVVNTAGFTSNVNKGQKQAGMNDLAVHLEYYGNTTNIAAFKSSFSLDETNSFFVDLDGNKLAGLNAIMTHASDL